MAKKKQAKKSPKKMQPKKSQAKKMPLKPAPHMVQPKTSANGWDNPAIRANRIAGIRAALARRATVAVPTLAAAATQEN